MDRSERVMVLEPLVLILKQRTGIAMIVASILGTFLIVIGFPVEAVITSLTPIIMWIGGQKYVDAQEQSSKTVSEIAELEAAIDKIRDGVQSAQELELLVEEVIDMYEHLSSQFEEKEDDVQG